jgi:hypothetical protein
MKCSAHGWRSSGVLVLLALVMAVGGGSGCKRSPGPPPRLPAARVRPIGEDSPRGADKPAQAAEQRRAQRAWCAYLEALYQRATKDQSAWPKLSVCNEEGSTAQPAVLERTAACSMKALMAFEGDPFTPEYAEQVASCGSQAIDAMALSEVEVAPYVTAICRRAADCGKLDYDACRAGIEGALGSKLGRAIGAINEPSRATIRDCLGAADCSSVGARVAACFAPIMDRLLWMPD